MLKLERVPLIRVTVEPKMTRGLPAKWNFLFDIPEIEPVAGPSSPQWQERVKREIEAFERWKRANPKLPFRNLRWVGGGIFEVEVNVKQLFGRRAPGGKEWLRVHIGVSTSYPRARPHWALISRDDRTFLEMVGAATNYAPFCIPPVWRSKFYRLAGRQGIAHFLAVFLIWLSTLRRLIRPQ